jgi:large subunit ribosomal protein L27
MMNVVRHINVGILARRRTRKMPLGTGIRRERIDLHISTFATKKAGGSSKNGRDSNPKYLGIKVSGGTRVCSGTIILKQRGMKYRPSSDKSVGIGRDHTLYAKVNGIVMFQKESSSQNRTVSVIP